LKTPKLNWRRCSIDCNVTIGVPLDTVKKKNKNGEIYCRFGFPFPETETSELKPAPGKTHPELLTKRNDPLLNSYNYTFILGWRANIDIRPVLNCDAVISYVAKYASKAESKSLSYKDLLHTAIERLDYGTAARMAYQKMLSSFVGERDISGQEVCHILFGLKLAKASCLFRKVCVNPNSHQEVDLKTILWDPI
jgi:ATP-dependent DNA helicase PIF1